LGPDKDPAFLQDTYKAVEEQFASNNPLNNAMLCYTAASVSFNVTTGKPLRSHSDLREEIKCCIEGYKKGQRETLLALDQKPAPSELCVELFNAGVDSVKNKCKNLDCHQDISDPATRLRLILTTAYNVIPNDFTELLLSRFGYCFPENTSREKKLKYEQMRAQLRSCYSWGRGKAMEECANLTFQQQEAQSTSASPASDQPGIKGPTPTVVAPQGKPTSNGAAAK
jgi:hypothetical protein